MYRTRISLQTPIVSIEETTEVRYPFRVGGRTWVDMDAVGNLLDAIKICLDNTSDPASLLALQALREKVRRAKPVPRPKELKQKRAFEANKRLKQIQTQIKRLKTAEKKWKRKVKYYAHQKTTAKKEA